MIGIIRQHPLVAVIGAVIVGALLVGLTWGISAAIGAGQAAPNAEEQTPIAEPSTTPTPQDSAAPVAPAPDCDDAGTPVTTADELAGALEGAKPGDVITMADGTFSGNFVATTSGTPEQPITLCGSADAVLDGGDPEDGYVFHLDGAQYWHLVGFTVTNGQKGVMADGTVGSTIESLTVHTIGDEAIHLRKFSTDNVVSGNTISNTGLRKPKFGEGIYIGTAESNWCDISDCQPDNSDRNTIIGNTISGTTSESVDIKEGTSNGVLRDNTFDGSAIIEADSWVDVKGNDWVIEGNVGTTSPLDGFQTHEILDGWGTGNVFRDNTANVNGPGFGFSLTPVRDNVVACSNTASAAGEGMSNVTCSS